MTPKKGRGIGAYLLVVVVLIVALVFLLNGLKTGGKETKYSDIMKYFDNYEVTAYTLDLGSGELKLTLDDGDKLTYDVPNVSVFRDDTKDYRTSYNQKHPDAPLQVDYYKIRDTSWLLTLIPTLVLLGLMIFLMVRFQSGEEQEEQTVGSSQEETVLMQVAADAINTLSIENPSDSFTLVNEGDGFVVEGLEGVSVSSLNVNNLVDLFAPLTAQRQS